MLNQVAGDKLDTVLRTDHRFELRPLSLEFLLALDLFALGGLFELGINLRTLRLLQLQLCQAALVVDGHCCPVRHCPLDVVDTDVVAKDSARVRIGFFNRGTGEADERSIRQRITHVPGESIDEVVLAAVRLVGNHDNIAPLREHLHSARSPLRGRGWD